MIIPIYVQKPLLPLRPEILLQPNIPKPLHGLNPRTIMGQEWWNQERRAAYSRNGYCCLACGVPKSEAKWHKWLEGHEFYTYDYTAGRATYIETVALCHSCHNYIHSGRMEILVGAGTMPRSKWKSILKHGDAIIKKFDLKKPLIPAVIAEWRKWRLVLNGKEYKGLFKTFEDWERAYR